MKIKPNIALSESGFVFNPGTGESFSLNPIGMEILELIREGKDYNAIRDKIAKHYEIEDTLFEKDFEDFKYLLKNYQIIETDEQA